MVGVAVVLIVVVLVLIAAAVALLLRVRGGAPAAPVPVSGARLEGNRVIVPLDIPGADREHPAVIRLVDDAANRVFSAAAEGPAEVEIEEVEVQNRDGMTLGTRRREAPRQISLPDHLAEPRARKRHAPEIPSEMADSAGEVAPRPAPPDPTHVTAPERDLADRFELPDSVRSRMRDPSDLVDLLSAILETAGLEPQVDKDVLKVGDQAVVVIRSRIGQTIDPGALNTAYTHFKESGARRGVVVTPGSMSHQDVRRRQAFDPNLLHAGPDGIQRMADAAAVGANPIDFAATPVAEQ